MHFVRLIYESTLVVENCNHGISRAIYINTFVVFTQLVVSVFVRFA